MRLLLLVLFCLNLSGCAYYFGNSWQNSFKNIPKTEDPTFGERPKRVSNEELKNHPLVIYSAQKELVRPETKRQRGPERLMMAKLVAGVDVEHVNNYLLESTPWGNSGTSGSLNPLGDYDFTPVILAAILYKFQDDTALLWPKTAAHIANVLLVEEGGKPHTKTPRTMRIMKDTENHILMTNISQYLKNQWLFAHGETGTEYNNLENGLEEFLLDNLEELNTTGQYEFNSKPYEAYTITALLILHSYAASETLQSKAKQVLDSWAWEYTQTSSDFRKSAPFRRRMQRFSSTSLTDNASSSMMKAWYLEHEKGTFIVDEIQQNRSHVLSALIYDYRPPAKIWKQDNSERLVFIGHGKKSSPETHSRGTGFLLSAGGFQRGEVSQLVARPIVLMLDDNANDLMQCFHINGSGKWQKWNNTGVHHRFAVGRSEVFVPSQYEAVDSIGNWKLYEPNADVSIVTYSLPEFGLIYLPKSKIELKELVKMNSNPTACMFHFGDGRSVEFDVKAPKGKWVITKVDGVEVNRKTDSWPRVRFELD